MNARELIARRAAQELKDGQLVNLGFGMPTQASNYLPEGVHLMFHGENGVIGVGPARPLLRHRPTSPTQAASL